MESRPKVNERLPKMDPKSTHDLPSALDRIDEIRSRAGEKGSTGVFLDYDGTLTPIVSRPEDAVLSEQMRAVVRSLTRRCVVAVISGRGLNDVRERVGIDSIFYSGSHGFEIAGPGGWYEEYRKARSYLSVLDEAEAELHGLVDSIPGAQIERKRYSIALHYRRAAERDLEKLKGYAETVQRKHDRKLRLSPGKCVYDFQPRIDWHKGKALDWLLETAFPKPEDVFLLYLGDDLTDEDAFRTIRDRGAGIVVRDENRPSEAEYALDGPDEVGLFLKSFANVPWADRCQESGKSRPGTGK